MSVKGVHGVYTSDINVKYSDISLDLAEVNSAPASMIMCQYPNWNLMGPLLLAWIKFNPSMEK